MFLLKINAIDVTAIKAVTIIAASKIPLPDKSSLDCGATALSGGANVVFGVVAGCVGCGLVTGIGVAVGVGIGAVAGALLTGIGDAVGAGVGVGAVVGAWFKVKLYATPFMMTSSAYRGWLQPPLSYTA